MTSPGARPARPSLFMDWVRGPMTTSLYVGFAGLVGSLVFVGMRLLLFGNAGL